MTDDSRPRRLSRRGLLAGAVVAGLGALVVADVAANARTDSQPLSDEVRLRHLLRRAGFGASSTELGEHRRLGLRGAVDRLLDYEQVDNSALDERLGQLGLDLSKRDDLQRWWLLRMIYTARPLEEKMTLFWHGLLTSAISKVGKPELMLAQNRFFRANAFGRFPDILKGISRDPAMMIWLDLASNRKGHPNENYARELMELFSLGIGNYAEQDVREGARAYTGWGLRRQGQALPEFVFNRGQHDDGPKTFLGQTGRFDGDGVVDGVVQKPESARFIARKLFEFFVHPGPTDEVLRPLVEAYTSSGYSIKSLVRAILTSDALYSPRAYRTLVKGPVELVVGAVRALGLETDARGLPQATAQMGQQLFNPPNVAGWPGGQAWLTSGTWLARLNFANRAAAAVDLRTVAAAPPSARPAGADAPATLTSGARSPAEVVGQLVDLLLDGQVNPAQRQVLVGYLTPRDGASPSAGSHDWLDERRRGALYLVLGMPEYHLG